MGRPIIAINLNDRSDRHRFSSSTEAARELGFDLSCVLEVVSGKALSAGGWYFHPEGRSSDAPILYGTAAARAKRDVTVHAVNLISGQKTTHRNATVAGAAFGISQSSVCGILSGKRKSENGYWFTHNPHAEPPAQFRAKRRCAFKKSKLLWLSRLLRVKRLHFRVPRQPQRRQELPGHPSRGFKPCRSEESREGLYFRKDRQHEIEGIPGSVGPHARDRSWMSSRLNLVNVSISGIAPWRRLTLGALYMPCMLHVVAKRPIRRS